MSETKTPKDYGRRSIGIGNMGLPCRPTDQGRLRRGHGADAEIARRA